MGPNATDRASLLARLKQNQKIDKAMISFDLGNAILQEESSALIGGFDLTLVADRLLYSYPLANQAFWSVNTNQIKYGNTILGFKHVNTQALADTVAIIDTGTSLLAFPTDLYASMLVALDK